MFDKNGEHFGSMLLAAKEGPRSSACNFDFKTKLCYLPHGMEQGDQMRFF
jgi:hypothetical protein